MAADKQIPVTNKVQIPKIPPQLGLLALFVVTTGLLLYSVLSMVKPQYSAESQLFIEQKGTAHKVLVAKEIKTLKSRRMVSSFIKHKNLASDPEFDDKALGKGPLKKAAIILGVKPDPAKLSKKERTFQAFNEKLTIKKGPQPQTIRIAVRSSDPKKSAQISNEYANIYIAAVAKGSRPVSQQIAINPEIALIEKLRKKIAFGLSELNVLHEDIKANPVRRPARSNRADISTPAPAAETLLDRPKLSKEQISALTTQLILARADREEAELRAKLVREMLEATGDIHATGDVLNSGLVQQLLIKKSRMDRRMADLSATLLRSHPRLKRLKREMSALVTQIKREAQNAVAKLENDAKIAAAREKSLQDSLDKLTKEPAVTPVKKVELPQVSDHPVFDERADRVDAIEREITYNKKQLVAAQSRFDQAPVNSITGNGEKIEAILVSRAVAGKKPVFPNKKPITLLGMLAAFCLGLIGMLVQSRFFWSKKRALWTTFGARTGIGKTHSIWQTRVRYIGHFWRQAGPKLAPTSAPDIVCFDSLQHV